MGLILDTIQLRIGKLVQIDSLDTSYVYPVLIRPFSSILQGSSPADRTEIMRVTLCSEIVDRHISKRALGKSQLINLWIPIIPLVSRIRVIDMIRSHSHEEVSTTMANGAIATYHFGFFDRLVVKFETYLATVAFPLISLKIVDIAHVVFGRKYAI